MSGVSVQRVQAIRLSWRRAIHLPVQEKRPGDPGVEPRSLGLLARRVCRLLVFLFLQDAADLSPVVYDRGGGEVRAPLIEDAQRSLVVDECVRPELAPGGAVHHPDDYVAVVDGERLGFHVALRLRQRAEAAGSRPDHRV